MESKYSIFDPQIGMDSWMNKPSLQVASAVGDSSGLLPNPVSGGTQAGSVLPGEMGALLSFNKKTFTDTAEGWIQGMDQDGTYKWLIGGASQSIDWNVTTANALTIVGTISATTGTIGGFDIGADYIRDAANSMGLASTVSGGDDVRFWSGSTFASRATAPFRVTEAGVFVATSATITGSITATSGAIAAFTIAATTISATNLVITSGAANTANIAVGTGSNLGGINSGNAGTDIAFWSGATFANRATAPFRVNLQGDVTMTSATIAGVLVATQGTFGGDGSDGALSISSGTTTISAGSAAYLVKNYSSISITGTASLAFSTPGTNGTIINIKSQGAVNATTSGVAFNVSSMGGAGGAGGAVNINGTVGSTGIGTTETETAGAGGAKGTATVDGAGGVTSVAVTYILNIYGKIVRVSPGSGGGGGGGGHSGGAGAAGGDGGIGGGALIIECNDAWNFTTGSISCAAANGNVGGAGGDKGGGGGGGGGAAGCVAILYKTLTADSGTYTKTGGNGANGGGTNGDDSLTHHGGGGGAGGGHQNAGGAGGNGGGNSQDGTAGTAGSGVGAGTAGSGGVHSGGGTSGGGGGGGGGGSAGSQYTVKNTEFG